MTYFNPHFSKIEVSGYPEAIQEINNRFRQALQPIGGTYNKMRGYYCPLCGHGEGESKTGMTENPNSPDHYTCFKCTDVRNSSPIDIIAMLEGKEHLPNGEKLKLAKQVLGIEYAKTGTRGTRGKQITQQTAQQTTPPQKPAQKPAQKPIKAKSEDNKSAYDIWHNALFSPEGTTARAYLHGRGLTDDLITRYNIGYARDWVHPSAKSNYKSERVIIPRTPTTYLARAIDSQNTAQKLIVGTQSELFLATATLSSWLHVIVEGEIDAILCRECIEESVIGLGGISNVPTLVQMFEKRKAEGTLAPDTTCLLMLDNDEAGREAQKKLAKDLKPLVRVISAPVNRIYAGAKDIGEAYILHRDEEEDKKNLVVQLNVCVANAYQLARTTPPSTEGYYNEPKKPISKQELICTPTRLEGTPSQITTTPATPEGVTLPQPDEFGYFDLFEPEEPKPPQSIDTPTQITTTPATPEGTPANNTTTNPPDLEAVAKMIGYSLLEHLKTCATCEVLAPYIEQLRAIQETGDTNSLLIKREEAKQALKSECGKCRKVLKSYIAVDYVLGLQFEPAPTLLFAPIPQPTPFKGKGKTAIIAPRYGKTIETLLAEGTSVARIAEIIGISKRSIYRYISDHKQ